MYDKRNEPHQSETPLKKMYMRACVCMLVSVIGRNDIVQWISFNSNPEGFALALSYKL